MLPDLNHWLNTYFLFIEKYRYISSHMIFLLAKTFYATRLQILLEFSLFIAHYFFIVEKQCVRSFQFPCFFTDNGIVLKVITIYNQETESMEEVILEELQIFKVLFVKNTAPMCVLR